MANLCPEGEYKARVLSQGFFESTNGTLGFRLDVAVFQNRAGQQRSVPYERAVIEYITEDTKVAVIRKLRHVGFEGTALEDLEPTEEGNPASAKQTLVKSEIWVVCKHEEYPKGSGKFDEKWRMYDPPKKSSLEKIKMWSGKLAAMETKTDGNGQQPPSSANDSGGSVFDDGPADGQSVDLF